MKFAIDSSLLTWYNKQAVGYHSDMLRYAGVAQLVEQLICNQQVGGSSPSTSSISCLIIKVWFI